jgi:hypothetical protein
MKYLCLIYIDEKELDRVPPEQQAEIAGECAVREEEWSRSGRLIAAERLEPVATATTLRRRNGKVTVTDGPFAETREQLGGFFLIEARDLNEALRIAADIPPGRLGAVEVRPIWGRTTPSP